VEFEQGHRVGKAIETTARDRKRTTCPEAQTRVLLLLTLADCDRNPFLPRGLPELQVVWL
jgi:hypothetical protein